MPTIVRTLTVATIYWPSTLHTLSIGSLQQSPGRQYDHLHFINELMQLRKVICPRSPSWPPGSWDWNLGMADSAASLSRVQEGGGYEEVAGAEPDPFPFTPPPPPPPHHGLGRGEIRLGDTAAFWAHQGRSGTRNLRLWKRCLRLHPPHGRCAPGTEPGQPPANVSLSFKFLYLKLRVPGPREWGWRPVWPQCVAGPPAAPAGRKGPVLP